MKILQVHNYYQQAGGEDLVVAAERDLLLQHGHIVQQYTENNERIKTMNPFQVAAQTFWSSKSYRELSMLMDSLQPDIVHVHNTFPLVSPSVYYAAAKHQIPVVQTVHNYRLLCPSAVLYRDGQMCVDCLGKKFLPLPGVVHACYHHSRLQTTIVAMMMAFHRAMKTYIRKIDAFICLSPYMKDLFIQAGFSADTLFVKPNFIAEQSTPRVPDEQPFALFVGRITAEKGIETLLAAWQGLNMRLKIAGDGPMAATVQNSQMQNAQIEWLGYVPVPQVEALMRRCSFLVVPSAWPEPFGRVVIEAYAAGTPVIAADIGALSDMIVDGQTGMLFSPGDADDLAQKADWACGHLEEMTVMGQNARAAYEEKYTPEKNYELLMAIYEHAFLHHKSSS